MSAELKPPPTTPGRPVADNFAPVSMRSDEANGTPSPWSKRTDRLLIVLGVLLLITGALMFGVLEYSDAPDQATAPPIHRAVVSNLTHNLGW
jgi:hypothetical protein